MAATLQTSKMTFGSGQVYAIKPDGTRLPYGNVQEASVNMTTELQTAFGEKSYPVGVADGHRTIEITCRYMLLDMDTMVNDLGLSNPIPATESFISNERGTFNGQTFTLKQGARYSSGLTVELTKGVGANCVKQRFNVTAVAIPGQSVSVTAAGVVNLAAGDSGYTGYIASYFVSASGGRQISAFNDFQNSGGISQLILLKRDRSPIDGSWGYIAMTFYAVRSSGMQFGFTENEWSSVTTTFQAFSNSCDQVFDIAFFNEDTSQTTRLLAANADPNNPLKATLAESEVPASGSVSDAATQPASAA